MVHLFGFKLLGFQEVVSFVEMHIRPNVHFVTQAQDF